MHINWATRFALTISTLFALSAVVAGGISYWLQAKELTTRLQNDVKTMTESLAQVARSGEKENLVSLVEAQTLVYQDNSVVVEFIDAETHNAFGNIRVPAVFVGAKKLYLEKGDLALVSNKTIEEGGYFTYAMRIPYGWVVTGRDDQWIAENRETLWQTTFVGLGLALFVSIGFASWIAHRSERRVRHMKQVLRRVGGGEYGLHIDDHGKDDLAQLAVEVNLMLDQLERGIAAIRQVSTDIAHDLRAPLSRLRMRLETVALDPNTPQDMLLVAGDALTDLEGLSQIFDAIQRLSRMQAGLTKLQTIKVDLNELGREVYELLQPSAEEAGHQIIFESDGSVFIEADRDLLAQALVNLVDNAIRHNQQPTRIKLQLTRLTSEVQIAVCDNGIGIPDSELNRVTERFVRLDPSRNLAGSGLGLSLVKAIAHLHHAAFTLSDNGPGLCATMTFLTGISNEPCDN